MRYVKSFATMMKDFSLRKVDTVQLWIVEWESYFLADYKYKDRRIQNQEAFPDRQDAIDFATNLENAFKVTKTEGFKVTLRKNK